jgi:ABC-2 type transport system ATP-binding protein
MKNITEAGKQIKNNLAIGILEPNILLNYAQNFALDPKLVNKAIQLQLMYSISSKDETKNYVSYQINELIREIENNYNKQSLTKHKTETSQKEVELKNKYNELKKEHKSVVVLENVEKSYRPNSFTLKNIDANFKLGEITGILGANANGKSTLIKIIVGELIQNKGNINFPYFYKSKIEKLNWQFLKSKIAYVPQELPEWFGNLKDNIRFEASLHGLKGSQNNIEVDFILERLGLTEYQNLGWNELSGGYKLRFALAKALVWKPSLLVLDEPLANLDIAAQQIVLNDLQELAISFIHPISIIITSQHIYEIEDIADEIIVLEQGKINYHGKPNLFRLHEGENIFEFSCDKELIELHKLLQGLPIKSLQQKGKYFILKTDESFNKASFINQMSKDSIQLDYFRDISHSVKQLFL